MRHSMLTFQKACRRTGWACLLGVMLLWPDIARSAEGAEPTAQEERAAAAMNTVRAGSRDFEIPGGYTLELVTVPELVQRPIVADLDDRGRLYVADSSGSNDDVKTQLQTLPHRIVRLDDEDGDGRFDTSTVFADRMMFPEGVLWHGGSVFVAAPPVIWKLTDADDDGVCDQRETWFDGRTLTGCANDLHGPYLGPDGWIYWCKGAFAEQTYDRAGRPSWTTRAAHIFRRRLEGGEIEPVMTGGMDNPVEVAFSAEGERFFTTTFFQHPGGGRRDGLVHAIYGGVYGKQHAVLEGHARTGPLMPVLTHLGPAAPSGLVCLQHEGLERDAAPGIGRRGDLVAACFNLHQVTRHEREPSGATFQTRDHVLVNSSDLDFHPTDVLEDADGSLLIVDTGGWYKLCCPTSQLYKPDVLGGIYRLRRAAAQPLDDPRGLRIEWATASLETLVGLLEDPRPAVVARAVQTIAEGHADADGVTAVRRVLRESQSPEARRAAVWSLTRMRPAVIAQAAHEAARTALRDPDGSVRHAAAHAAALHRDQAARGELEWLLQDASPARRRVAAEALGRLGRPASVPALVAALQGTSPVSDRVLQHALVYALMEIGDANALRGSLAKAEAESRAGLLLALDQVAGGKLTAAEVIPGLFDSSESLHAASAWILGRHREWGREFLAELGTRVRGSDEFLSLGSDDKPSRDSGDETSPLEQAVIELAMDGTFQEALGDWWQEHPEEALRVPGLWKAVRQAKLERYEPALQRGMAKLLERRDAAADRAILQLLASSEATATEGALLEALRTVADDERRTVEDRLIALSLLTVDQPLDERGFSMLLQALADEGQPGGRVLAARGLASARLKEAQQQSVVDALPQLGPVEVSSVLPLFRELRQGPTAERLVKTLADLPALAVIPPAALRDALGQLDASTRQPLDEALARVHAEVQDQPARLQQLLERLPDGDIRRGQAVFHSAKAACFSCHGMGYRGGDVGPDLTRIGQVRAKRDLLEAIVFPSASFVRSYEPYSVVTREGTIHQGVLREEQATRVVLVNGQRQRVEITRSDIEEMQPSRVSIMPSGLDQLLSEQELADLLAFLESSR